MKKIKSSQLSIPSPCSASWADMTPGVNGKFCGSCQKTVIDFTRMSDAEVLSAIAKATGGCCGRFTAHQLERPMQQPVQALHSFTHRSAFFTAAAFAGLLTLSMPAAVHGQSKIATAAATTAQATIPALTLDTYTPPQEMLLGKVAVAPATRQIEGVITDGDNNHLVYAFVTVKGTHLSTKTDSSGKYVLNIPVSTKDVVLLVQCIGYPDLTVKIKKGDKAKVHNVIVKERMLMGDVMVVDGKQ